MMTTETTLVSAGLIFDRLRDFDIVKIGNRVCNAFESLEQSVTGVRILSNESACISSPYHNVKVTVFEDHVVEGLAAPAPMVLEVAIDGMEAQDEEIPRRDTILAHALKSLHWTLAADQVKWVTPGAILSSADFVMATTQPDPPESDPQPTVTVTRGPTGVIERRYIFPSIEETDDLLNEQLSLKAAMLIEEEEEQRGRYAALLLESDDSENDMEDIREKTAPLRLSAWMISFAVALFALPVGASLLVINLLKGENLRLSSQAMALTGTFIALDANGATAQTMSLIQGLIG